MIKDFERLIGGPDGFSCKFSKADPFYSNASLGVAVDYAGIQYAVCSMSCHLFVSIDILFIILTTTL